MEPGRNKEPDSHPDQASATDHPLLLARESAGLSEDLIAAAMRCNAPPAARQRPDGWTPERIRRFLEVLADTGVVTDAARAAGMTPQAAYRLRNSAKGRAFDLAWHGALVRARRRIADVVVSRALNGCVDVIVRDGKIWGERHRFDNRLTMAVLTRLDAQVRRKRIHDEVPSIVAQEFDEFVDIVCDGGERAAEFLRARYSSPYMVVDEAEFLDRTERYLQTGEGLAELPEEEENDDDLDEEADGDEWHV